MKKKDRRETANRVMDDEEEEEFVFVVFFSWVSIDDEMIDSQAPMRMKPPPAKV